KAKSGRFNWMGKGRSRSHARRTTSGGGRFVYSMLRSRLSWVAESLIRVFFHELDRMGRVGRFLPISIRIGTYGDSLASCRSEREHAKTRR
ncbi:hypothetical protein PFISCL1PPCAC_27413, partial [Pristionchus fissidentatus]